VLETSSQVARLPRCVATATVLAARMANPATHGQILRAGLSGSDESGRGSTEAVLRTRVATVNGLVSESVADEASVAPHVEQKRASMASTAVPHPPQTSGNAFLTVFPQRRQNRA
jgi:hypothetical protein